MPATSIRGAFAAILFALATAVPVSAHDFTGEGVAIAHPWSRPAGEGRNAAGFFEISNTGQGLLRLTGIEVEGAARTEIHVSSVSADGVAAMRGLPDGIVIAPGRTFTFAPGGYHAMIMNVADGFEAGERVPGRLFFVRAGEAFDVAVEFVVEAQAPHH